MFLKGVECTARVDRAGVLARGAHHATELARHAPHREKESASKVFFSVVFGHPYC
jgi:hypothetical protein